MTGANPLCTQMSQTWCVVFQVRDDTLRGLHGAGSTSPDELHSHRTPKMLFTFPRRRRNQSQSDLGRQSLDSSAAITRFLLMWSRLFAHKHIVDGQKTAHCASTSHMRPDRKLQSVHVWDESQTPSVCSGAEFKIPLNLESLWFLTSGFIRFVKLFYSSVLRLFPSFWSNNEAVGQIYRVFHQTAKEWCRLSPRSD